MVHTHIKKLNIFLSAKNNLRDELFCYSLTSYLTGMIDSHAKK